MALKSKDNDGKRGRFSENESLNQSKSPLGASIPTNNSGCVQHKAIQGNMNNERRGIQPISSRDGSTDKTGNKSGEGESSTTTTTTTTTTVPTNSLQPQSPKSMPEVAQTEEDQEAEKDGSSSSKKDKSNRRKGKWTVRIAAILERSLRLAFTYLVVVFCFHVGRRRGIHITHNPALQYRCVNTARGRNLAVISGRQVELRPHAYYQEVYWSLLLRATSVPSTRSTKGNTSRGRNGQG
jgi:hypothetical protein